MSKKKYHGQVKSILEDLESFAQDCEYLHQISAKLRPAIELARKAKDKQLEKELIWEHEVFRFMTNTRYGKPEPNRRFYPLLSGTTEGGDSLESPDIKIFNEDSVEYLKRRVSATKNPVLKARYADMIWDLTKEPEYGGIAVHSYLAVAEHYYKNTWYFRLQDALDRCVYLGMIKVVDESTSRTIKESLLSFLKRMVEGESFRFCGRLVDTFCALKKDFLTGDDYDTVRKIVEKCITYSRDARDFHLERSFLGRLATLSKRFSDGKLAQEAREAEAASCLKEAESRHKSKNYLAAAAIYKEALDRYTKLGDSSMISTLKKKLQDVNRKVEEQLKTISAEVEVPEDDMKKIIDHFVATETIEESLRRLAASDYLVPSYRSAMDLTKQMEKDTPLQFMVSRTVMDEKGHLVGEELSPFDHMLTQNITIYVGVASIILDQMFAAMKKEKGMTPNDLTEWFKKWGLVADANLGIMEHGFEEYFAGDYTSAIHILIPQLEAVLRRFFHLAGIQVTSLCRGGTRETGLTELLQKEEVKTVLGEDLWWYYHLVLVSPVGRNLRNRVAHGLLTPKECSFANTNLVLHLFLVLTRFALRPKPESDEEQKSGPADDE